jgi:hypothetical protein
MSLFGNRKRTYVSSTVYNLAGDVDKRPNFLKATVLQSVLTQRESIAKSITDAYLSGPGVKLQGFTNWANNYGFTAELGLASGTVNVSSNINFSTLASHVPFTPGSTVNIHSAEIDSGDYTYWGDQYVATNHPELLSSVYKYDINSAGNLISITYKQWPLSPSESFVPIDFSTTSRYLYVGYNESTGTVPGSIVTGTTVNIGSGDPFPSTVGYNLVSSSSNTYNYDITTQEFTTITYSDGRPSEYTSTTTYTPGTYTTSSEVWEKTDYMGPLVGTNSIYSIKYIMHHDVGSSVEQSDNTVVTTEIIPTNVTKTTSTRTVITTIEPAKSHRTDTQQIIIKTWGPMKTHIYKFGSGNATLDAMFATTYTGPQYLPIIPIRLNNRFISDTSPTVLYPLAKKAMKRAIGANFDDIEASIADNANLGDIDYAYAMFGVSLNTKENSCRKYIYKFFKGILDDPNLVSPGDYTQYLLDLQAAEDSVTAWNAWRDSVSPGVEPVKLPYPVVPINKVKISSSGSHVNYRIEVLWSTIVETVGTGLIIPTAKAGDVWITVATGLSRTRYARMTDYATQEVDLVSWISSDQHTTINWQETDNTWRKLVITGLVHRNFIYGVNSVFITAAEALADLDESGFIIPLNEDLYRSMGMKDKTQMATASCFLVFNSYQIVKQKWYQTDLFKFLLIVVAVVLTVFFPPAGAAAKAAAVATGTALGLSGTTALIIGFIVNYLAAIIITKLIMDASTHVLGDKIGTIVGTVISIITLQVAQGLIGGQSVTVTFNNMMQAPNLLKLTIPVGNSYANYINESSKDILKQTEQLMQDAQSKSKEIAEKYEEMFGNSDMAFIFDPKLLAERNAVLGESMDSFLARTLMTGSDIVDISLNMLHDFADITLSTELK